MSCYYHPKVPTLTVCPDCGQEICATCSSDSVCPGCKLGRAMRLPQTKAITTDRPHFENTNGSAAAAAPSPKPSVTVMADASAEERLLAALTYPLWPLALILLFLRGHVSPFVRYHTMQALAVNALGVVAYFVYTAAATLPVVGWQSALVLPILLPTWFILNLYLAVRAYGGHLTRVPLAAEYATRYSQA